MGDTSYFQNIPAQLQYGPECSYLLGCKPMLIRTQNYDRTAKIWSVQARRRVRKRAECKWNWYYTGRDCLCFFLLSLLELSCSKCDYYKWRGELEDVMMTQTRLQQQEQRTALHVRLLVEDLLS